MPKKNAIRARARGQDPRAPSPSLNATRQYGNLGYNLRLAYLQVQKVFLERMATHDLRPAEYAILAILEDNEYVTQKHLGEALSISPPNLAVVLDRLEKRDLVERLRSEVDRRVQVLLLTDAGHHLLGATEEVVHNLEIEASSTLTGAERAKLISLLQKIFLPERASSR